MSDAGPIRDWVGWIGAAMACYDTALQYAKARKQFQNRPIASHQMVQDKLVFMITEISKAQLLALHIRKIKRPGSARSRPGRMTFID